MMTAVNTVHICTTQSLRAGIDLPPLECDVCEQMTCYIDWCGTSCDTCGAMDAGETYLSDYIREIRIRTGLSRKEIAVKAGLKPSTIKKYEWVHPSEKYHIWFKAFIKKFCEDLGEDGFKAKKESDFKHDIKAVKQ